MQLCLGFSPLRLRLLRHEAELAPSRDARALTSAAQWRGGRSPRLMKVRKACLGCMNSIRLDSSLLPPLSTRTAAASTTLARRSAARLLPHGACVCVCTYTYHLPHGVCVPCVYTYHLPHGACLALRRPRDLLKRQCWRRSSATVRGSGGGRPRVEMRARARAAPRSTRPWRAPASPRAPPRPLRPSNKQRLLFGVRSAPPAAPVRLAPPSPACLFLCTCLSRHSGREVRAACAARGEGHRGAAPQARWGGCY